MERVRILHVIPSLSNGGAEKVAVTIARHQSHHFEVHLVTWLEDPDNLSLPGLVLHRISFRGHGIQKIIWLLIGLRILIRQIEPHAIISHLSYTNILAHFATRKKARSESFWSVHHNTAFQGSRLETFLVEKVYRRGNVIAVSEDILRFLRARGSGSVRLIPNPLPLPKPSESLPRWDETQILRIVAVGRIVAQKNYQLMIASMSELQVPFILEIFGSGNSDLYKTMISRLPMRGDIFFRGNVDSKSLYEALAGAHVFLMTSDVEGEPSSLLEAAAMGLPVVGRDTPGLGAAVRKVGGFMPGLENDPSALAVEVIEAAKAGKNKIPASSWAATHDVDLASHLYCELLEFRK